MGLALIVPGISFADTNLGRVTLQGNVPIAALAISGPDSVTGADNAAAYLPVYSPANTTQRGVVWSIQSGGSYASIDASSGVLSVLEGAELSSVTIRATSSEVSSIYVDKAISVTYDSGAEPEPDYTISETYQSAAVSATEILRSNTSVNANFIAIVETSLQSLANDARIFGYASSSSPWVGVTSGKISSAGPFVALISKSVVTPGTTFRVSIEGVNRYAIKVNGNDVYVTTDGTTWTEWLGVEDMSGASKFEYGRGLVGSIYVRLFNNLNLNVERFFE